MNENQELTVTVSDSRDGRVVVVAGGECDLVTAPVFEQALRSVGDANLEVALDLSGLTFLDSSTLHMLCRVKEDFEGRGSCLVLVSPSPIVRRVLAISSLDAYFEVREGVEPGSSRRGRRARSRRQDLSRESRMSAVPPARD